MNSNVLFELTQEIVLKVGHAIKNKVAFDMEEKTIDVGIRDVVVVSEGDNQRGHVVLVAVDMQSRGRAVVVARMLQPMLGVDCARGGVARSNCHNRRAVDTFELESAGLDERLVLELTRRLSSARPPA